MRISDWSSDVCASDLQVLRAGQQLGTELAIGSSLVTFSHSAVAEMGDFAEQMVFLWSFPPATADVPVYEALRADLNASGEADIHTENLKATPMQSWIGLYALLQIIRSADLTEFRSEERRVGKECVSPCRSRWSPNP